MKTAKVYCADCHRKTGAELQLDAGRDNHLAAGVAQQTTDGVRQAYENADWWWHDCAMRALTWLADLQQPFSAFDLTELGVPEPDDHHRWGALFRAAATQNLIRCVGYAPSRRPTAGGSICRVWQGVSDDVDAPR